MLRTNIGKSSRLFISILVIQDHIESVGKPILLKGDAVLLNGLLAQMLSDIAPKPSTTFSIQICQIAKHQLGPTNSCYPAPPSSFDIATARNPNSSVTPIWIWSHQDGIANSFFPFVTFRSYRSERPVPLSLHCKLFVSLRNGSILPT